MYSYSGDNFSLELGPSPFSIDPIYIALLVYRSHILCLGLCLGLYDYQDFMFRIMIRIIQLLGVYVQDATSGALKDLGEIIRKDPSLLFTQITDSVSNVLKRDCVYFGVYTYE